MRAMPANKKSDVTFLFMEKMTSLFYLDIRDTIHVTTRKVLYSMQKEITIV